MYGVGVSGNYGVEQKYVAGLFIPQCHVLLQVECLNSISMHQKKFIRKIMFG